METKHRFLKDGKVYGSVNEMPVQTMYPSHQYKSWCTSLVKLECSEKQFDKIFLWAYPCKDNVIDITLITTVKDGMVYFKEVESESQMDMWIEVRDIIITETSRTRLDICKSKFTITRNN